MQMRTIPEVERFAYPSAIKTSLLGAFMPYFVSITCILLVIEPLVYALLWNQGSRWVMQIREFRKWKHLIVVQVCKHGITEEYMSNIVTVDKTFSLTWCMLPWSFQILEGHFVYANEENPGSWTPCLPFYGLAISMKSVCGKFQSYHDHSFG